MLRVVATLVLLLVLIAFFSQVLWWIKLKVYLSFRDNFGWQTLGLCLIELMLGSLLVFLLVLYLRLWGIL